MSNSSFLNFDIQITHKNGEQYDIDVNSPVGDNSRLEFNKSQLLSNDNSIVENDSSASLPSNNRLFDFGDNENTFNPRILKPLDSGQAKNLGKSFFSTIFGGELYANLKSSIVYANQQKANLRIRLNLTNAPALAVLPWEYLCNEKDLFLAKDRSTPVLRYLNHDAPVEELLISIAPLRVLVVISLPFDQSKLNAQKEWENIKNAFEELEKQKKIEFVRLENATFDSLEETLALQPEDKPFHVLHFIGHGAFKKAENRGYLLFENTNGTADPHSSEELADILRNYRALRLIVLNSCEGASLSPQDSYSGTAQDLLYRANVPSVIAMQYEISDIAALTFSERFYKVLALNNPIEEAVWSARQAMSRAGKTEWVTPVLYMRSENGQLFDFKKPTDLVEPQNFEPIFNPTASDKHFNAVINSITQGNLVPFIGLDANLFGRNEILDWNLEEGVLPSSQELAGFLASRYDYPFSENLDLTSVSQYALAKELYINRIYNLLSQIFKRGYPSTEVHKLIAKISALVLKSNQNITEDQLRHRFIVITTNYDNQLENALEDTAYNVVRYTTKGKFLHQKFAKFGGNITVIETDEIENPNNYSKLSGQDPVILKLPGAIDPNEQQFAITEDHYSDYLTNKFLSGLLPTQLTGKIKVSNNLFIGSSMRNWYLRALLYRVWGGQMPGETSWVVHPNMPEIDKVFWKASNVEVIEEDFDDYITELSYRLNKHI